MRFTWIGKGIAKQKSAQVTEEKRFSGFAGREFEWRRVREGLMDDLHKES
jgi:hypothetical protein